ncbi:MAG: hypothetical protein H0V45_07835 [Actinobacteria bacterium]|nr:hypothetical protein [Actinomycetota bacterium]
MDKKKRKIQKLTAEDRARFSETTKRVRERIAERERIADEMAAKREQA